MIVHKYLKGAIDGDSISQFELGKCYLKGNGIEQNLQQAIYWLVQAATQGHLNAEIELALYYSEGLYDKPDYNQTIFWYSKAAKTSNWAKECLGDLYYYGIGVEKDLEKAVSYYRSSIENRFDSITRVNNDLMVLLAEKEKKQNELIENIKKAEMSDINALINLFDFYAEPSQFTNYRKAYQFYEKAAELGDVEAQAEIAYSYLIGKGKRWIKDSTNAFKWLKMASNQNQNFALYTLGQCYEHGIEIQKNITEAVKYYKLSAQHGNIEAQMKLGDLFFYGLKVIRDYNEAFKWYKLACDNQGEYPNPEPFYKVGYCLFYGLGCDEDKETAVYYLASCLNMESTYYKCLPLLHEYCKSNPELLGDLYSKDIWDCTELDVVLNDYKDYLFSFEY